MISSRCLSMFRSRPAAFYIASRNVPLLGNAAHRVFPGSIAPITTADMGMNKDYKPDGFDKLILTHFGRYAKYEDVPERIRHDEMDVVKAKFRVEVYFIIIISFMVYALWYGHLLKNEREHHNEIVGDIQKAEAKK